MFDTRVFVEELKDILKEKDDKNFRLKVETLVGLVDKLVRSSLPARPMSAPSQAMPSQPIQSDSTLPPIKTPTIGGGILAVTDMPGSSK